MSSSTLDKKIAVIVGFIIEGHPKSDIQEWATSEGITNFEETWGAAMKELESRGREAFGGLRKWALLAMQEAHRRLMDIGDYQNAAKVAEKIAKTFTG